jgi:hypothetical protein
MNNVASGETRRRWVGAAAFGGLLALSGLALPVSAFVVEAISERAENWIVVVYAALMLLAGAAVGMLVPATPALPSRGRRAAIWAGLGLLAAVVGFFLWLITV